ncbi:hypothetical protein AB0H83_29275 [Dactylosporangium sp. NPDC050688]
MTALLSLDSKNFTLACDGCGQLVTDLAPTMGDWAVPAGAARHGRVGAR